MQQYHDLLRHVLATGKKRVDRTGVGTISVFGAQARYDLRQGFPLVTTKKVHLRSIIHELLWFIAGDTNIQYLKDNKVSIWDEWADENGDLGPVYGKQWRQWARNDPKKQRPVLDEHPTLWPFEELNQTTCVSPLGPRVRGPKDAKGVDQLANVIQEIRKNPSSRRLIISAWNVADITRMALPPCHTMFQFYVDLEERSLSCQLYQRSADLFLGVPFNIASYALLTQMIAQVTGYQPGDFVHTFGDLHIYLNHLEQVELQLSREPRALPVMRLNPEVREIDDFRFADFTLENYDPWPAIKAEVAV